MSVSSLACRLSLFAFVLADSLNTKILSTSLLLGLAAFTSYKGDFLPGFVWCHRNWCLFLQPNYFAGKIHHEIDYRNIDSPELLIHFLTSMRAILLFMSRMELLAIKA